MAEVDTRRFLQLRVNFLSYEYHNRTVTLTKCNASGHEVERRLLDNVIQ